MDSFKTFLIGDLIFIGVCVMALLVIELIDAYEEKRSLKKLGKVDETFGELEDENDENKEVNENEL